MHKSKSLRVESPQNQIRREEKRRERPKEEDDVRVRPFLGSSWGKVNAKVKNEIGRAHV